MSECRSTLERELDRLTPPRIPFDQLARRRDRKRRDQRIRAGVLGLAIAIAVGWVGVSAIRSSPPVPADPTPTPELRRNGEVIVFEPRGSGKGWDLAAQDPETGEVRTIVETDGIVDCPGPARCRKFVKVAEWSSDGRWIAFEVSYVSLDGEPLGPCGPTTGIWVKSALGDPKQLTTPCDAPPPGADIHIEEQGALWTWSPVGAQLAYARVDGETDELFVVDPSDGRQTSLGSVGGGPDHVLEWSPDGTRIAYAEGGSVYQVEVDGEERSLLADSFVDIIDIAWSPDGTQILVQDQERSRLQVMNADGSDLHLLFEGEDACCETEWSPAGDRILYMLSPSFVRDSHPMVSGTPRSGRSRRMARTRSRSSTPTAATLMLGTRVLLRAMLSRSGPPTERRSPITTAAFGWSRTPTERVAPNLWAGRRVRLVALPSCMGAGLAADFPNGTLL